MALSFFPTQTILILFCNSSESLAVAKEGNTDEKMYRFHGVIFSVCLGLFALSSPVDLGH